MMDTSDPLPATTPAYAQRVLVLQGGGALGSYQDGAYQALCHHDFEPEWIAGISIGAINAAIIAGNPREKRIGRLKEFWEMVSAPVPGNPVTSGDRGRSLFNETSAALIATFGVPGFFTPRFPPAPLWPQGSPQSQSYYDTTPLRATLERLVDFDRINDLKTRLSVGAVSVTTGNFRYFDNFEFKKLGKKIGPEHIMASGALPPGFPSIEIEGEHFWDGGIASNTPLDYVLDEETSQDLLIFQVDLFSARGPLPMSLLEAAEREKDIRFSSRTRMNTDKNKQLHNTRKALRDLIGKLPDNLKNDPSVEILCQAARENTVTVVHLIYRSKNYESSSKDYDFSHIGMVEHWRAGERDVHLSMRHKDWLERPQSGETMVTYDLTGDGTETLDANRSELMGMLTGKTAVVTGSTSGIGLAYARAFAGAGANIVINGMGAPADIERERAATETDFKVKAIHSPADMTKPAEIADMIALGEKTFGSVDVLVNNAGIQFVSPIEEFPVDKWDAIIAINLSAAFHAIRAVAPGMKKRSWGRIINTASAHSLVASPFKSAYVSAKHGIAGLTKTVALEVATFKITCNCISPGYVWTPLVEKQIPDTMKARNMTKEQVIHDVLLAAQPTKEFVTSEQVAALALFLCGDDAAQITGANLSIDGGWTAE